MKTALKSNGPSLVLTFAVLGLGLMLLPQLPDRMGVHFNWRGETDGFSGKPFAVLFLPLLTLVLLWILPALVRLSPRDHQMENSHRMLSRVNLAVALMLNLLQLGCLLTNLDPSRFRMAPFITFAFAALLVGLGNFMGKIERNFFIGFRTPWALASERNWLATHRFAAKLMVGMGLGLLIGSIFTTSTVVALAALLVACLVPVFYSYWYFARREPIVRE